MSMPTTVQPQPPENTEPTEEFENALRLWRIDSFRELKFTQREAELLADAMTPAWIKIRNGDTKLFESPLSYSRVKKMLEDGCPPKLLVKILT